MAEEDVNMKRRRFLTATASVVGGVGVVAAAYPFIASMRPSARAQAAGAPVDLDVGKLEPGQRATVSWRGKPVWVVRRSDEHLEALEAMTDRLRDPDSEEPQQPDYAQNGYRSIKPEFFIAVGVCTHLGCVPSFRPELEAPDLTAEWGGGFFCPCHGSLFDMAGRVFRGVPAPLNLEVPPHRYETEQVVVIGEDEETV